MKPKVRLNVGGERFETYTLTLQYLRNTKLASLSTEADSYDVKADEFFFDRNPRVFSAILNLYRTGEFHFPSDVCSAEVRRELDFWGIEETFISPCCTKAYFAYEAQQEVMEEISDVFSRNGESGPEDEEDMSAWRYKIWVFLNDTHSSTAAKVRINNNNNNNNNNNMMRKQSFKCSRSSMIVLHSHSNAVTKCLLLLSVTSFLT